MKNDALKKHHFWILAGVGLVFSLLAFLMVMFNVSSAVASAKSDLDKQFNDIKGNNPKGTKALEDMDKQKEVLLKRREELWKTNYEQQKSLFAWPNHMKLKPLEDRFTKFGEPIARQEDAFDTLKTREVYETAYERIAQSIVPTTFPGRDWRKVLRHVTAWGDIVPTSNRVWLALEDLWVQKTLLLAVNDINAANRNFVSLDDDKTAPALKRKFRNRIWDLELEVPTSGRLDRKGFLVKLTNRTDRMQVLGANKTMTLKVWLNDSDFPVYLRFQKEFVKAHATFEIRERVDVTPPADRKALMDQGLLDEVQVQVPGWQAIPPGTEVVKIRKVEQVLDDMNVPVRQVLDVVLGYKDARHAAAALKAPEWWPADAAVGDAGGTGGGGPPMSPLGGGGPGSPDGEGGRGMGGPGGMMMGGGGGGRGSKVGGPAAVLDANRNRYVEVTKQVRRMPVAVVLLVDQMFMQDALVAYANSPLRLQITQFHWKRFRGDLRSTTAAGASSGYGGDGGEGGEGGVAGGGDGGEGGGPGGPGGGRRGMMGPGAADAGSPDSGAPGGLMGAGLMGGGLMGGPGGMSPYGSAASAAAESQVTSGLVELTIYGIVTLYEKYPDQQPADATPPAGGTTETPAAAPPAGTPAAPAPAATGQPATPATPPAGGTEPKEQPKDPATPPTGNPTPPAGNPPMKQ
ncbi:MAG: hypothetical protein U0871_25690 [Gemmataceae bacterium]